jgi:hypothetical protein
VNASIEKCTGGNHHGACSHSARILQLDAEDATVFYQETCYQSLPKTEVGCTFQGSPHLYSVEGPIGLGSRGAYRGAARAIQQPELYSGAIDNPAHDATKSINLPDQVAFADATDGGIARHLSNEIKIESKEGGVGAEPSRGRSGLATSVATPDNNHIEVLVEYHSYTVQVRSRFGRK